MIKKLVSKLFKDDYGNPLKLAPTQEKIAEAIAYRLPKDKKQKRHIAITTTQYGKSLALAVGILLRVISLPEKFAIVAPTKEKARVIMGYVIQHIFDNAIFLSQIEVDYSLERLKRERSKDRITFKRGGEVRVFTAEQRYKSRAKEALMGFGAPNLVIDESGLLSDDVYATAKRMVGGHTENFIFEIGNPFYRNHFFKTWTKDENYLKIFVNAEQAIKEGRLTEEMLEEMKDLPLFDILYLCKFPDESEMDERGYMPLLKYSNLETAFIETGEFKTEKYLGVDIGRGGNWNVYVIRDSELAKIKHKDKVKDLMQTANNIEEIAREEKIPWQNIFIDDAGVGGGVVDRLKEKGIIVNPVVEGASPANKERFANLRAEAYWNLRQWILDGGKLIGSEFWELLEMKYKINASGKIQLESKEEMRQRGVESPDFADALMLTFASIKQPVPDITII